MTELPNNLDTILHIGAGRGEELRAYLNSNAKRILLVEPSPNLAEQLRQRTKHDERVQVVEAAITDNPALTTLSEYNLLEAASLYQPTGLRQLFPGLRITAQHTVATQAPEQLLEHYMLSGEHNLLVIQAPGAEMAIINALANSQQLGGFTDIHLSAPTGAYYESNYSADDIQEVLNQHGYELKQQNNTNPDWPELYLTCSPLSRRLQEQLEAAQTEAAQLKAQNGELTQQLQTAQNETEQANRWLTARKKEVEELTLKLESDQQSHQQALNAANENLGAEQKAHAETREELQKHKTYLANRKKQLEQAEQKAEQLERQLQEQGANNQRFDQLEAKLAGITRNITGHMDKQLHNTSQQLESSIALQAYLQSGHLPIKPAGPALSANMALYMAEQIETSQYDLIIEFGSGASTGFLARTVLRRLTNSDGDAKRLGYQQSKDANGRELAHISPDEDDLPKRIISFEHRKEQTVKIEQSLAGAGLQHVVELVHAPLVDYQHQEQHFLHYGCEKTLEHLANLYEGRTAKFLVLVNGPPSKTGLMARFPAMPKLLNVLGTHTVDIVLCDTPGDDTHTITERWCGLLEQRGISFRKDVIHNEKAAIRLAINHA